MSQYQGMYIAENIYEPGLHGYQSNQLEPVDEERFTCLASCIHIATEYLDSNFCRQNIIAMVYLIHEGMMKEKKGVPSWPKQLTDEKSFERASHWTRDFIKEIRHSFPAVYSDQSVTSHGRTLSAFNPDYYHDLNNILLNYDIEQHLQNAVEKKDLEARQSWMMVIVTILMHEMMHIIKNKLGKGRGRTPDILHARAVDSGSGPESGRFLESKIFGGIFSFRARQNGKGNLCADIHFLKDEGMLRSDGSKRTTKVIPVSNQEIQRFLGAENKNSIFPWKYPGNERDLKPYTGKVDFQTAENTRQSRPKSRHPEPRLRREDRSWALTYVDVGEGSLILEVPFLSKVPILRTAEDSEESQMDVSSDASKQSKGKGKARASPDSDISMDDMSALSLHSKSRAPTQNSSKGPSRPSEHHSKVTHASKSSQNPSQIKAGTVKGPHAATAKHKSNTHSSIQHAAGHSNVKHARDVDDRKGSLHKRE